MLADGQTGSWLPIGGSYLWTIPNRFQRAQEGRILSTFGQWEMRPNVGIARGGD